MADNMPLKEWTLGTLAVTGVLSLIIVLVMLL